MTEDRIYVKLLDEGVDVWRPVQARSIGSGVFLVDQRAPEDTDEVWEYGYGDHVIVERRILDGRSVLVAIGRSDLPADSPAEGSSTAK